MATANPATASIAQPSGNAQQARVDDETFEAAEEDNAGVDPGKFVAPTTPCTHLTSPPPTHNHNPPNSLTPFPPPPPTASNPDHPPHLREISSLASWTVSTYKPGCGVDALRSPSPSQFWQSDGPQPHLLTIHFFKLVKIVKLRVYLDFELDESYTPTRMLFFAGSGMHDLTEFAEWQGEGPRGWQDIELVTGVVDAEGAGVLRCFLLQIRVCENHQNGKDTHVRGVQIFARDERVKGRRAEGTTTAAGGLQQEFVGLEEPDWMGEPELR